MTSRQKSHLGQGLCFGLFFAVLGGLIKFWTDRNSAPYYAGQFALVVGILLVIWGVFSFFSEAKS